MFNFKCENDMKKPLFNQAEREQIKKQEGSAYERYFGARLFRAIARAMANVIDREMLKEGGVK